MRHKYGGMIDLTAGQGKAQGRDALFKHPFVVSDFLHLVFAHDDCLQHLTLV